MNQTHNPPVIVVERVMGLLEVTFVPRYIEDTDETLAECQACGELEGHEPDCPIPACFQWLETHTRGSAS